MVQIQALHSAPTISFSWRYIWKVDPADDYKMPSWLQASIIHMATLPAFPSDIPTHPLLIIDFELIQLRNPQEIDKLWEAATKLGFW